VGDAVHDSQILLTGPSRSLVVNGFDPFGTRRGGPAVRAAAGPAGAGDDCPVRTDHITESVGRGQAIGHRSTWTPRADGSRRIRLPTSFGSPVLPDVPRRSRGRPTKARAHVARGDVFHPTRLVRMPGAVERCKVTANLPQGSDPLSHRRPRMQAPNWPGGEDLRMPLARAKSTMPSRKQSGPFNRLPRLRGRRTPSGVLHTTLSAPSQRSSFVAAAREANVCFN